MSWLDWTWYALLFLVCGLIGTAVVLVLASVFAAVADLVDWTVRRIRRRRRRPSWAR